MLTQRYCKVYQYHAQALAFLSYLEESCEDDSYDQVQASCAESLVNLRRVVNELRARQIATSSLQEAEDLGLLCDAYSSQAERLEVALAAVVDTHERCRLFQVADARQRQRKEQKFAERTLQTARYRMQEELAKMDKVDEGLMGISANLKGTKTAFSRYRTELTAAGQRLKEFRRKAEADDRYLRFARNFAFTILVYAYLKRFNVLRLMALLLRAVLWVWDQIISRVRTQPP